MINYKERNDNLKNIKTDFKGNYGDWYSYLINDWIPRQKDSEELMYLFIDCEFDPTPFLRKVCSN